MSRLLYAIKSKNRYEVEEEKRRKIDIEKLRQEGLFRVSLNTKLATIKNCLDAPNVSGVVVNVSKDALVNFGLSRGYEEMSEFELNQESANKFIFRSKELIH